jgi:hypothetical protein
MSVRVVNSLLKPIVELIRERPFSVITALFLSIGVGSGGGVGIYFLTHSIPISIAASTATTGLVFLTSGGGLIVYSKWRHQADPIILSDNLNELLSEAKNLDLNSKESPALLDNLARELITYYKSGGREFKRGLSAEVLKEIIKRLENTKNCGKIIAYIYFQNKEAGLNFDEDYGCSISFELLKDPVITACQPIPHRFERKELMGWFQKQTTFDKPEDRIPTCPNCRTKDPYKGNDDTSQILRDNIKQAVKTFQKLSPSKEGEDG